MSKRVSTVCALGAVLLLAGGAAYWQRDLVSSLIADPVYTDTIPEDRPKRPDRRLLARYASLSMPEILAAIQSEGAATPSRESASARSEPHSPPPILAMLPDAPLPYSRDDLPRDEAGLRAVVASRASQSGALSSPLEQWEYGLALAALDLKLEGLPEVIHRATHPAPESDTFPVRLARRETEWRGPLAVGDFDGVEGLELVTAGGAELQRLEADGGSVALDGLAGTTAGASLHPADFDGDGDLDLFVARSDGLPDSLLRNGGEGTFTDETLALGLLAFGDTTAAVWLDFDRDGLLDLLIGYRDRPLELHHQTEGGGFQPIAWDLKLWVPRGVAALAATDFDGDGYADLLVARDDGRGRMLLSRPAEFWSDWRFEEMESEFGFADGSPVSALCPGDVDNDGHTDLLLATASPDPELGTLRLLRNGGGGSFIDATEAAGLRREDPILSLALTDLDLDGYNDLLIGTPVLAPDRVFANRGGTGFREVSVVTRGAYLDATVAWLPMSRPEAGLELLSVRGDGQVRRLEVEGLSRHWLRVAIPGRAADLRLVATARDRDWVVHTYRRRIGGDGVATFGLDEGERVERLEIFEAAGTTPLKTFENLESNREIEVKLPPRPRKRNATALPGPVAPEAGAATATE